MPDSKSDVRSAVKLDFMSGIERLPSRPKADAQTTQASVTAGRELGFFGRVEATHEVPRIDGRRLRSRGANTQMNIKVTAEEKDMILSEAAKLIQDPSNPIGNIGEFIVHAVRVYQQQR